MAQAIILSRECRALDTFLLLLRVDTSKCKQVHLYPYNTAAAAAAAAAAADVEKDGAHLVKACCGGRRDVDDACDLCHIIGVHDHGPDRSIFAIEGDPRQLARSTCCCSGRGTRIHPIQLLLLCALLLLLL